MAKHLAQGGNLRSGKPEIAPGATVQMGGMKQQMMPKVKGKRKK